MSAPSSLAVEFARRSGQALAQFLERSPMTGQEMTLGDVREMIFRL